MNHPLHQHLQEAYGLSQEGCRLFQSLVEEEPVAKGAFLLTAGKVCRTVYFIQQGSIRRFFLHEGKEINTHFHFEQNFVTDLKSLRDGKPSGLFMQALEDTTLLKFSGEDLQQLYQRFPEIESMGRRLLESLLLQQEEKSVLFQRYSPEERYQYLLQYQPKLLQRVSLTHIASYLGISRESL